MAKGSEAEAVGGSTDRRGVVLTTALETFLRYGYRKTSMEDIARAAAISRPGLYFLFTSKQELFAAAVTRALEQDLETAARVLGDGTRSLQERLVDAFDVWTGRWPGSAYRRSDPWVVRAARPASSRAIGTRYGEQDT